MYLVLMYMHALCLIMCLYRDALYSFRLLKIRFIVVSWFIDVNSIYFCFNIKLMLNIDVKRKCSILLTYNICLVNI